MNIHVVVAANLVELRKTIVFAIFTLFISFPLQVRSSRQRGWFCKIEADEDAPEKHIRGGSRSMERRCRSWGCYHGEEQ